ncbi:hypothetical protein F3J24_17755 [Comamonas sp. Tr-654]|uniref:hypothetical protein n=1 Tax=Comamonas sp. Tr-654 TaxID=2608341 RepID=UPI00141DFF91|nr:hypothetical protein [Comamonas sp. Tr-654]NIF85359.1 hypothetical protein [Comamonas sp. Tr-654]
MTTPPRKDLPNTSAPNWNQRVTEELRVLMGRAGNGRALTARDLIDSGIAKPGAGGGLVPGVPGGGDTEPDLTPPPMPTGFTVSAGLSTVFVEHDAPGYTQGHGHDRTVVYGVLQTGSTAPTFDQAVVLFQFQGTIGAYPAALGTRYRLWIKWQSQDGVQSVSPAGGTNGLDVQTGRIGNNDLGPLIVEAGNLANGSVSTTKLAAQAVDATKFAAGIEPVSVSTSDTLPTVKSTSTIVWQGKLYRWDGGKYTAEVAVVDLSGQIDAANLADNAVTVSKIAAGAVSAGKLASDAVTAEKIAAGAVDIAKFAAGIQPVTVSTSPTLPTVKSTEALTWQGKLYRWDGTKYTTDVSVVDLAGQIAATQIADGSITTPKLAANSVVAGKIAANAVTSDTVAANAITSAKIAAGAVSAEQVAAKAITVEKLSVALSDNLIANNTFANDVIANNVPPSGWSRIFNTGNDVIRVAEPTGASIPAPRSIIFARDAGSTGELSINATSVNFSETAAAGTGGVLVEPGDEFLMEWWVQQSTVQACQISFITATPDGGISVSDVALTPISNVDVYGTTCNSTIGVYNWGKSQVVAKYIGATPKRIYFRFSHAILETGPAAWMQIAIPYIRRRNAAKLIVDGAITARQIAANSITAGQIVAGTITATELATGAVTAAKIAAGAITANELAAGSVTATQLAANSVVAGKVAANAVTANEIAANAITTAKIAAGAVNAGQIAAKAITVEKLAVALSDNLIENNAFANDAIANNVAPSGWSRLTTFGADVIRVAEPSGAGIPATRTIIFSRTTGSSGELSICPGTVNFSLADVASTGGTLAQPGDEFLVEWWVQQTDIQASQISFITIAPSGELSTTDVALEAVSNIAIYGTTCNSTVDINAWGKSQVAVKYTGTTPKRLYFRFAHASGTAPWVQIALPYIRRRNAAKLIVDGAITAGKIAVGAIAVGTAAIQDGAIVNAMIGNLSADKITAGTLDAARIAAGTITSTHLAANSVIAGKIAANAVTAGTIAANAVTAAQIAAGAITVDKLAAGSVTAEKLTVGTGGNLCPDSAFTPGLAFWGFWSPHSQYQSCLRSVNLNADYSVPGSPTYFMQDVTQYGAGGSIDTYFKSVYSSPVSVVPGERYELSIYGAWHRCNGRVHAEFRNASGGAFGLTKLGNDIVNSPGGGQVLSNYVRAGGFVTVPAGAVSMVILMQQGPLLANQTDKSCYMFLTRPFIGLANPNQTELSPWTPSSNTNILPDGITTPSIAALAGRFGEIDIRPQPGSSGVIRVWDENNVLRVELGIL